MGNCKSVFNGDVIKWSIPLTKIRELIKNNEVSVNEFNGEQYLNVEICKKEQEDEWGKTHYVRYDDFDPKSAPQAKETAEVLDDDLPF